MNLPLSGGCSCGAVRYESTKAPLMMFRCHCRDCQRASGGAYVPVVLFASDGFRLTKGAPKKFGVPSSTGGNHIRGFCAECGSRLTGGENDKHRMPFIGVVAGSLDDPSIFKPTHDIFVAHAQPWDRLDDALPKHEGHAPR